MGQHILNKAHFLLKAYHLMKVGLVVDLNTHGGKIEFEFCRPALCCLERQNSNFGQQKTKQFTELSSETLLVKYSKRTKANTYMNNNT